MKDMEMIRNKMFNDSAFQERKRKRMSYIQKRKKKKI